MKSADTSNNIENQTSTLQGAGVDRVGLTTLAFDSVEQKQVANTSLGTQLLKMNPYQDQMLSTLLGRMNKIRDFQWSSAAVSGTKAATIHVPNDLFHPPQSTLKNIPLISRLAGFRYFRAGVKLRITVNATLFHSGKLMFTWMPHYRQDTGVDETKNATIYQASNNRPMILDVPSNSSLVMDIPWITPFVWLDLQRYILEGAAWHDYIASVDIWILHPLINASASSPSPSIVNVTIEAAFTDAQVAGFQPQNFIPLEDPAICQMESVTKSKDQVVAGVREQVAHTSHQISSIPVIGDAISKTLTAVFDGLGLNKPSSVGSSQMANLQLAPDFTQGEGLDYSTKLSMTPTSGVGTNPSIFSEGDDMMDVYKIARTPSLRYLGTFTSSSAVGAIIHSECCDPMFVSPEISEDGAFAPTYIAYASYPFTYWRGGLKYFLQFTAAKSVTCKLRLSWTPSHITDTDAFALLGGEFPSRIIDITGSTQTEFTIPFISQYACLPVTTFQRDTNPTFSDFMNAGFWQLSVLNPVTGSTSATSVVHYAIWKAAAEDYTLSKPREIVHHINPAVRSTAPHFDSLSDDEDEDFATVQCDVWNFFTKQFTPILPVNFVTHDGVTDGESTSSLRTLMHRYVFLQARNTSTTAFEHSIDIVPFPGFHEDTSMNQHWYWVRLFYYWRGSLRFKMIMKTRSDAAVQNGIGRVCLQTTNTPASIQFDTPWNTNNGCTVYNTNYRPSVEFEVPWFYQTLFVTSLHPNSPNSPVPPDDRIAIPGWFNYQVQNNGSTAVGGPSYDIFMAVGDDFSMGFLSAPPIMEEGALNAPKGKKVTTTLKQRKLLNRNLYLKSSKDVPKKCTNK